ncbi:hypothetical protein ACFY36_15405 [Actinoplanes sp. NPDC000266]
MAVLGGTVVLALLIIAVPLMNGVWGDGADFTTLAICCLPAFRVVRTLPDAPGRSARSRRKPCGTARRDSLGRVVGRLGLSLARRGGQRVRRPPDRPNQNPGAKLLVAASPWGAVGLFLATATLVAAAPILRAALTVESLTAPSHDG